MICTAHDTLAILSTDTRAIVSCGHCTSQAPICWGTGVGWGTEQVSVDSRAAAFFPQEENECAKLHRSVYSLFLSYLGKERFKILICLARVANDHQNQILIGGKKCNNSQTQGSYSYEGKELDGPSLSFIHISTKHLL